MLGIIESGLCRWNKQHNIRAFQQTFDSGDGETLQDRCESLEKKVRRQSALSSSLILVYFCVTLSVTDVASVCFSDSVVECTCQTFLQGDLSCVKIKDTNFGTLTSSSQRQLRLMPLFSATTCSTMVCCLFHREKLCVVALPESLEICPRFHLSEQKNVIF